MPKDVIIAEGKTTNEAIEKGLKILNVSRDRVEIKILENEDKRSFFSILAPRVVKVELRLKEENKEVINKKESLKIKKEKKPANEENLEKSKKNVEEFLNQILTKIENDMTYIITTDSFGLNIEIKGKSAGDLIGYRGETLYAMQTIISAVANKGIDEKIRVLVDIENYKERREKTLQNLAIKLAKTVERTGKNITLEPMQAYERKIIHSCLQDSKTVKTESIGEAPRRRVVISLK